jgi:amidase
MARAVRERAVSPVELIDAHIARIEARNPELNAVVVERFDEAREEAREAEAAVLGGGEVGPLHGLPFTVKEAIALTGTPSTNGCLALDSTPAREDAVVVSHLRDAGAIPIAKTNVSELCLSYDSVNPLYGATRNPHDPSRSAGGSSGGEGAAVAAGMTAFGVGSDMAGSIRFPAHLDGVAGIKPGRGVVPGTGHPPHDRLPACELMGSMGPMARTVEDLLHVLLVMARADLRRDPGVMPRALMPAGMERPAVAVFEDDGLGPVSANCRAAVRRAAGALVQAGHEVVEERPPRMAEARTVYDVLAAGDLAVFARSLGERRELVGPRIAATLDACEEQAIDLDRYVDALHRRRELEREVYAWLEDHPVVVCPAGPVVAFPVGEPVTEVDGRPLQGAGILTLCTFANVLGLPAAAVPVLRTAEGLPAGVQVIGRRERELEVLTVAWEIEMACSPAG